MRTACSGAKTLLTSGIHCTTYTDTGDTENSNNEGDFQSWSEKKPSELDLGQIFFSCCRIEEGDEKLL